MANVFGLGSATAAYWFQFFLDAGIPPADAGNYAVTFTENRIQKDMIVDLTKDYLNEMGVKVLGDMIAILKHAKNVHTQATREKVLKSSGLSDVPVATASRLTPGIEARTTRSSATPVKVAASVLPSRPTAATIDQQPSKTSHMAVKSVDDKEQASLLSGVESKVESKVVTNRTLTLGRKGAQGKGTVIRLKPEVVHEVPVPKVRNVTREQEGAYKVILPSGLTKMQLKQQQKKNKDLKTSLSVFDRLGAGHAGDDSEILSPGTGKKLLISDVEASSVFRRLGEKKDLKRPATDSLEDSMVTKKAKIATEDRLGSEKVLSMSAGILGKSSSLQPISKPVHLRLGGKSATLQFSGRGVMLNDGCQPENVAQMKVASISSLGIGKKPPAGIKSGAGQHQLVKKSDSSSTNRDLSKRLGRGDDLIIHLQSENSGSTLVRHVGSESKSIEAGLLKSGNVVVKRGSQQQKSAAANNIPQNFGGVSVTLRLGPKKTTTEIDSEKLYNAKQNTSNNRTNVFSRLGSKKAAIV